MWASLLYLIIAFLLAREISSYHDAFVFKSYVVMKNKIPALILARHFSAKTDKKRRKKDDEYRITVLGIVIYCVIVIAVILSLVLLFCVPEVKCESFDTGKFALHGDSYNERIVGRLIGGIMFAEAALFFIHTLNHSAVGQVKRRFDSVVAILLIIAFIILSIVLIFGSFRYFGFLF